jgi:hypothetical protein
VPAQSGTHPHFLDVYADMALGEVKRRCCRHCMSPLPSIVPL